MGVYDPCDVAEGLNEGTFAPQPPIKSPELSLQVVADFAGLLEKGSNMSEKFEVSFLGGCDDGVVDDVIDANGSNVSWELAVCGVEDCVVVEPNAAKGSKESWKRNR